MFDFLFRRDFLITFGAQSRHHLPQLLMQCGERVVAERDAHRELL
jgi:hypothetical protein